MDMLLAVLLAPTPSPAAPLRPSPPPAAAAAASHAKIREIFMLALSFTMTKGKIVSWVKSEGDKLSKGESVVVVESEKLSSGETFYDRYIASIMVEEGGVAPVGPAIALLAEADDEIAEAKANSSSPSSPPPVSPEITIAENMAPKLAAALSSAHPALEGGRRIVGSPYAKKLAKELKIELAGLVGDRGGARRPAFQDILKWNKEEEKNVKFR